MNTSLEQLKQYYEIEEQYLEYIGSNDYIYKGYKFTLEHYNIMDPNHPSFKSTVAFTKKEKI